VYGGLAGLNPQAATESGSQTYGQYKQTQGFAPSRPSQPGSYQGYQASTQGYSGSNQYGSGSNYPFPDQGYGFGGGYAKSGQKRSFGDYAPRSGRDRGGDRGGGGQRNDNKRPKFEYEGKNDDEIKVEPIVIDRRFNFFNLPKAAKILLVSNVPSEIAKPKPLFHLFSFYGDVTKVKILPHKQNVALVEFETATMACIARDHLDQVQMKDHKLVVSFSRFGEIRPSPGAEGLMEDFTGPDYMKIRRFSKEDIALVSLKRISQPKKTLHVNNLTRGVNLNQVKALFVNKGVAVTDAIAIRKKKEKKDNPTAPSRAMVFLEVASISDALVGMALVGGSLSTEGIPAGLRVSFTDGSVVEERNKYSEGGKGDKDLEVAENDQPL
jgi:hypothetical protein